MEGDRKAPSVELMWRLLCLQGGSESFGQTLENAEVVHIHSVGAPCGLPSGAAVCSCRVYLNQLQNMKYAAAVRLGFILMCENINTV